jgi:hypothetical protein
MITINYVFARCIRFVKIRANVCCIIIPCFFFVLTFRNRVLFATTGCKHSYIAHNRHIVGMLSRAQSKCETVAFGSVDEASLSERRVGVGGLLDHYSR